MFLEDAHGAQGCVACHGGVEGSNTKAAAHEGMVKDPSANYQQTCGVCHPNIASTFGSSLHSSFHGYETLFEARSGMEFENNHHLEEEFANECGECHTTCGECHVSRPRSVEGGLVQGHRFMPTPSQSDQCTACHGSRVGEEYLGTRDGYSADVHYVPQGKSCTACHSGHEMHGDGTVYATRYEVPDMPRCEDCHSGVADANSYHSTHWDDLQCQVCHSQDYKNCNKCHVGGTGIREPSYITFKVGKNPIPDEREYEYVVLRHIPIAEDTYDPWGVPDLENYDALPSWKYASPHNIRRWTARTDTTGGVSCGSVCHNQPDVDGWFLRQADIDTLTAAEQAANEPYIVPNGPPPWN